MLMCFVRVAIVVFMCLLFFDRVKVLGLKTSTVLCISSIFSFRVAYSTNGSGSDVHLPQV